jgi:hypothetical protein
VQVVYTGDNFFTGSKNERILAYVCGIIIFIHMQWLSFENLGIYKKIYRYRFCVNWYICDVSKIIDATATSTFNPRTENAVSMNIKNAIFIFIEKPH